MAWMLQGGKYREALAEFQDVYKGGDIGPSLLYNIAVCYYKMKQISDAINEVQAIIDLAKNHHPGLFVTTLLCSQRL